MQFDIRSLVRRPVLKLKAYPAHEIPCTVKLDANESPIGPGGELLRRIERRVRGLELNRYPDPEAAALRKVLARKLGVPASRLLLGNGSDELIGALITTFGGPVLYPVPSFAMYGIIARGLGMRTRELRLDNDFDLPTAALLRHCARTKPRVVFLSSPNNPTGNRFSEERIRRVVETAPGIVVIDEAYQPFAGGGTWLRQLGRYPNVVVLRTLSKVGLAGLRLGILAASEEIVGEVNKVRLPFNVGSFTQAAAFEAISDGRFLKEAATAVRRERGRLERGLRKVRGVKPVRSDANFIFFTVDKPGEVYAGLLERGVLIRNLEGSVPGGMRVTVGTREQCDRFLDALREVMG